jgi:uncharacterized membrane protein YfcA
MDTTTILLLCSAVLIASSLQAATGIGYGVIAGPVFLVALSGIDALQISALHNLMIALALTPFLRMHIDKKILLGLLLGSAFGILTGFILQISVSINALKIVATLMLSFVMFTLLRDLFRPRTTATDVEIKRMETFYVGALAGLLGGMLAMPGPLAGTWMALRGVHKQQIRATLLAFFVFAYGANTALYSIWHGFEASTLRLVAVLTPILGLGLIAGSKLSSHISEVMFRVILLGVLMGTLVLLIVDLVAV